MADFLRDNGHRVTVLSTPPHYQGRIDPHWRYRPMSVSREEAIKVVRVWVYASPGRKIWQKGLNYLSFLAMSLPAVPLARLNHDVVIAISPPLLSGLAACYYAILSRCPLIFDIQDLYPETAIQLGVLKGKRSIAFFEAMERFIYRKSTRVAVISEGFRQKLLAKGVAAKKVTVLPNWADTSVFSTTVAPIDKKELGLGERFTIMFLGTLGRAQGCEVIIEAATLLKDRRDIGFCLLGDGVARPGLEDRARLRGLDNVSFLDSVPHRKVPAYLAAADAFLVHLVANDLYKITIPSKSYEYLAMGKPVLMGVEGEAAHLVEGSGSGITFTPEDPVALAKATAALADDPNLCLEMGKNARKYSEKYFSRESVLHQYMELISSCKNPTGKDMPTCV